MVSIADQRDHLNALTDCIIAMSRIHAAAPAEWLTAAAEIIRTHLAPRQVVSLWDGKGADASRWEFIHLGVSATQPAEAARWNSQFMHTLDDAGITPSVIAETVQTSIAGRLTRGRYESDHERRTFEAYSRRLGVESLDYFGGPLDKGEPRRETGRTLFLSVWSAERVAADDAGRRAALLQAWRAAEGLYIEAMSKGPARMASLRQRLTPGQLRVAEMLAQGLSKREVAARLQRSEHTIHDHTKSIYQALDVSTRAEFMALWSGTAERAE
ncbi:MAG: response regulator transcription factor [Phycisphaerales bacterium]|nr:response regulator transcription factor [Phycisphaerales bacterium]